MREHYELGLSLTDLFVEQTFDTVTSSGHEHIDHYQRTLYISNHDDIVREAALINRELAMHGLPLAHAAAGKNLFSMPLLRPMLMLQPTFPVTRERGNGLAVARAIEEILSSGNPVWVAQSSGRCKNGNYRTHPALIEHLAEARSEGRPGYDIQRYLEETTIIPVAVSCELEPTASAVARLLMSKKDIPFGDFFAVMHGIIGHKGNAHVAFTPRLRSAYRTPFEVANAVTHTIHENYRTFGTHKAAYAERSRFDSSRWQKEPVDIDLITDPRLRTQVESASETIQPLIVSRYAMPERNRLRTQPI
jgi:hypothetical protein